MQDKKNCTSPSSKNAFSKDFLDQLKTRDNLPVASLECESRGPWVVIELPGPLREHPEEPWAVLRSWENPKTDRPAATFCDRELALLYAAGQEVGGRRSVLSAERESDRGKGHEVLQLGLDGHPGEVGHIALWDEDTFAAFQNLETLLRAIDPLAQVLDAAGGSIVELVGRRLMVG